MNDRSNQPLGEDYSVAHLQHRLKAIARKRVEDELAQSNLAGSNKVSTERWRESREREIIEELSLAWYHHACDLGFEELE